MEGFAGTWRLVRLALRRDRIKLSLWLIAIIGTIVALVPTVQETYGSPTERAAYAASMGTSMVARMFGGVLDGDSLGAIVMVESYLFIAVLVAFMSTLLIMRHTRQNEEAGSTELLQSARVGRYANLTAAMIVAIGANVLIGLSMGLALISSQELPGNGGWLLGAAFCAVGISFAAIGAVAAQLSESGRGANNLAGLAIGLAFLLRAIGDGFMTTTNGHVASAWPSWLSPLGWGQQLYPFTRQDIWVFGLFGVFIIATLAIAYTLLAWRDVGAGILPARKGPARAAHGLLSPFGLVWRLQRGILFMWGSIIVLLGALYGSMSDQFKDLLTSSEVVKQYIESLGGEGAIVEAFLSAMVAVTAIIVVAYVVQVLQRLRIEESTWRLEAILASSVGRLRWLMAYIGMAVGGAVLLLVLLGVSTALSAVMTTGSNDWSSVGTFVMASLAYMPAIGVFIGLVVACFGIVPRAMIALSWFTMVFALLISQLGALLKLPTWLMDLSPFTHISAGPSEAITTMPLVVLTTISLGLLIVGIISFKRRNIITS